MRILLPTEMIELAAPKPGESEAALERLRPLLADDLDEKALSYGVKEGWIQQKTVCVDDCPKLLLWYHVSPIDNGLIINGAARLLPGDHSEVLEAAALKLAADHNCRYIEFQTKRRGMAAKAQRFGYRPVTVTMRRDLKHG